SQCGFVGGGERWMREALPSETSVGFTGTPLTAGDRVTRHVFGDYADVYDIRQSVADGATVPIYYEPRIVKLTIDEPGAKAAEAKIAEYATRDEDGRETPENIRIPVEELYGAPEQMALHVRSKAQRKALADRFKDPANEFRLAIVVDMWLTGFDVPCAHTMYLDKPLAGHNLMQAIARVNRVYGEKPGGLIVDLI